jgi:transposase
MVRMKAYSLDIRERIVAFVQSGGAKTEAAARFGVSRKTVYRYLGASAAGALAPKTSWGGWRKIDPARVLREIRRRPDATQPEIARIFKATPMGVSHCLRRLGITFKKKPCATSSGTRSSGGSSAGNWNA